MANLVLHPPPPSARRPPRWLGLVLVSLLAHVAVLCLVGFGTSKLKYPDAAEAPIASVQLPLEFSRRPTRSATAAAEVNTASGTPRRSAKRANEGKTAPTQANAAIAAPAHPALSSPLQTRPGEGDGPAAPSSVGDAVREALRSRVGCDAAQLTGLTPQQRDRCNEQAGRSARLGPRFDVIPPEKRAYYDAVQAAYQASRHPEAPNYIDANGNVATWGHPPAVGCTFKRSFRPGASLSDKIKATGMIGIPIGPLSCGLALPQGSMTPEIGIPPP